MFYKRFFQSLMLGLLLAITSSVSALELSFTDLEGEQHSLSDYRGKWVVLNVWASWCPPCMAEIPELTAFHDTYAETQAVVLGANMEPQLEESLLKDVVGGLFISYPVFRLQPEHTQVLGQVSVLPTSFLISPDGELVDKFVGQIHRQQLEKRLNIKQKQ